jgi:hypothetical protein
MTPAMAIILPHGLTAPEIRVLQEFRRMNADTLALEAIKAVKHPAGGGEAPAASLVVKGYLQTTAAADSFTLTPKAKDFLAIEAKPEFEEPAATAASAAASSDAEGA